MSKKRKRNAIHSGIGDHDDLFVKQPAVEDVTEDFRYAARLRGKKRHSTMIYPETPFEYGVSYTGQTLEVYNEKEYQFGINAHPEKTIAYRIEQTKELPVQRMWEAKACFEAEVMRMNMKYAFNWKGKKAVQKRNTVEYAVNWSATVTSKAISDARSFFTSQNGQFIGYGDASTWRKHSSGYVYDYSNVSRFSGIIAKQYYGLQNYEAEFDFKTVLATNDQHVGGRDDDIVGLIFKAKDNRNFYMMLWERDERVKASWRAPDNLEGFNMLSSGESAWEDRVENDGCKSSSSMSYNAWTNYVNNRGWRQKHRRIYKVTNGIMRRVDTTPNSGRAGYDSSVKDLGNGKGWDLNEMHSLKVKSVGKDVEIYVRDGGRWSKIFDFETDWANGSFGLVNVSQAVQFHKISVQEKNLIQGRIPETGWHSSTQASKTLGTGYNYCINSAKKEANKLKVSIPSVDSNSIEFLSIRGSLRDSSKGSITSPIGESTSIVVKAGTHTVQQDISGRVPSSGWYEFDGIGSYVHAQVGKDFIKSKSSTASPSTVTITSITGEVYKDPKITWTATGTVIASVNGQLIARSNNPADVGKKYSKCYVRCGVVEVTPDHRDYRTGLLVFDDIAKVFKEDYAAFFNRPDYINKKATYELLYPVKKPPPKPPVDDQPESSACLPEPPKPPEEEEEVIQCWDDFDFDGKKLIMWSCEFPIEKTEKLFEDHVFAYRGWVTFNPLASFNPNKWTWYNLMPIEATIDPVYDEIKWAGRNDYDRAPVGTKVIIRTKEWYKAIFPADIVNQGIVNSDVNVVSEIPPAPEHFWHPAATDDQDVSKRMPDHFGVVHYLLDAWGNHPDVVMWFESNPTLTTDTADKRPEALAQEGRIGMPIVLTSNDLDRVAIHCKEDPRYLPWTSGKYIGYGKVNGKRPFFGDGSGKADMVNVSTQVVFFPENLVKETLKGPFIDIYDKEFPDHPRVRYRLHSANTLIDFYSDHMDAHIWYSDWYSKWVEEAAAYQATMLDATEIEAPLNLDPMDPNVSEDYDPDNTIIERIEVSGDNSFVKLWVEEDKGVHSGLMGTYYRFPLTSTIYEEEFKVTGDYKEWKQSYEIKSFMDRIEIPVKTDLPYTILAVTIDGNPIPESSTNGWKLDGDIVMLKGSGIIPGMMEIHFSTGDIQNIFYLEKGLGEHIELYVNGVLLDKASYTIHERVLTIDKSLIFLHDWINIQSYKLDDLFDPTKRNYLGEKQYTQLDFQEDIPSLPVNPNYNDLHYEGSFCFNWGYGAPAKLLPQEAAAAAFRPAYWYPGQVDFAFNVDMEVVYPIGNPVDISNFTGEWKQWDVDPILASSGLDGPGDWHGPPEPGFPEVTNLRNQSYHSGWYNPAHKDLTDYVFKFKVQARQGDDDMYGAIFKFDPVTQNFYSFEWDAYWSINSGGTGVKGMGIYKMTCTNPQDAGIAKLNYSRKMLAHADISWGAGKAEIHEIKVSTIGNAIKVWTDDTLRFDIVDNDNPYLKGAWGPVTVSQPSTYFWDFWLQTYKRATFTEEPNFRKGYALKKDRPLADEDSMIEIELDAKTMQQTFASVLNTFADKIKMPLSEILSVEYFITEDKSEHPVYFKPGEPTFTVMGESKLFSNVRGQNPPSEDPVETPIEMPPNPTIPVMKPPTNLNPRDGFTISWNGYIYASESGVYRFRATVNDGFRLWVRNTEIIKEWHVTGEPDYFPTYEGSIYLEGGKWHPITANYFDSVGQALVRLHWAQPGKGFMRIAPAYLTPYLGYKLFAQVKKARPLPWHPMVHNGYYYHEDQEKYLYAQKQVLKRTPDAFHEVILTPRPQQGSAIIVRDNEGNNLRKVTFYDDDWNLTLENKEAFNGNGYAKYFLNYKGIDKATLKVKLNDRTLMNADYLFNEEESSIEFMEHIGIEEKIEVRYKLLYSYILDMNPYVTDGLVERDAAKILLHSNYNQAKMKNMEIIYEAAAETPYYRAREVILNPLLNHLHTGFLYITETEEQAVKDFKLTLSEKTLSNSGLEKVLLTIKAMDQYENPTPNKLVKIYRDDILIDESLTNEAGEVYLYDQPDIPGSLISTYRAECEGITKEALLNYYVEDRGQRYALEVISQKLSVFGGTSDEAIVKVTLRDENWNPAGAGHSITLEKRNTHGEKTVENLLTDSYGQVTIKVSGLQEVHGNIMLKVSHDMNVEHAANYVHLKVIGG